MKKIKDLTNIQKIMVSVYVMFMVLSLLFYINDINNPDNYRTTITCGDKTYTFNHSVSEEKHKEICPEAFIVPKMYGLEDLDSIMNLSINR